MTDPRRAWFQVFKNGEDLCPAENGGQLRPTPPPFSVLYVGYTCTSGSQRRDAYDINNAHAELSPFYKHKVHICLLVVPALFPSPERPLIRASR